MSRLNLVNAAMANAASLQSRYDALLGSHSRPESVKALFDQCQDNWKLSINCWAFQLKFFLDQGIPYNKYRYVQHTEGGIFTEKEADGETQTPVDWEAMTAVLQRDPNDAKYAPLRKAFNLAIDGEEEFSYSAFFISGQGAGEFGEFSMHLIREAILEWKAMSFLRHDSLQHYVEEGETTHGRWEVLLDKIQSDVAHAGNVTQLLCLKFEEKLRSETHETCLGLICTKDDYLEGQIGDRFGTDAVERVRVKQVSKERLRLLNDLQAEGKLDAPDAALGQDECRARDFHKTIAGLKEKKIKIDYI